MSISPIVDEHYRIQVADLDGTPRQVEIANVTYQGVEEMTPVLHFVGQTKRLVLSARQVEEMLQITGTILYPHWIGTHIILHPHVTNGETSIALKPVTKGQRGRPMPTYVSEDRRGWGLALSVVMILLVASALFTWLNLEILLATLQELRNTWLPR